jgi:transposase
MDMHRDSGFAGRLEVVSTGRRRRWSAEEKIRIVEESLSGHRQASATARRHDIPVSLLFKWRKEHRRAYPGGAKSPSRFVPAVVAPCEAGSSMAPAVGGGRMEIALSNGRRVVVGADVDTAALGRVLDVLEGRR